MDAFFNALSHFIKSVMSHHPTTWVSWSYFIYVAIITFGLIMVAFGKKLHTIILFIAGLAAVMVSIGAASDRDSFAFWGWLLVGVIFLSRPSRDYRAHRKMAKQKKVRPTVAKVRL